MSTLWGGLLAVFFPFLLPQGIVQDSTRIQFYEAMAAAPAEGIPALLKRLDAIAAGSPSSASTPFIQETIQVIGFLHPGTVPDQAARLKALKSSAAANPALTAVLQRLEILQPYYDAAVRGNSESVAGTLNNPALAGSLPGYLAMADAALRAREYARAEAYSRQAIEADPYSPLLANAYMNLGLSATFRGETQAAARHFQRALAVTPLATIYGDTRNFLFTAYRFARSAPAPIGEIFDDMSAVRLGGATVLKDPQSLVAAERGYYVVDREQLISVAPDGKVLETKPARKLVDASSTPGGKLYLLAEDGLDLGTGTFIPLSLTIEGKPKALKKMRSLAVAARGDIYIVDQDYGLLRGTLTGAGTPAFSVLAPTKARLLRVDSRGNLYQLAADGKSVLACTRDGKQITSIVPAPVAGKEPEIECFALDSLNHLYILDANSIQVFAMIDRTAGLDRVRIASFILDSRPQFKNLRVLAVNAAGEMATIGKNEDTWVYFR
jgi:tetratricopeptide (TPR) repeat protein